MPLANRGRLKTTEARLASDPTRSWGREMPLALPWLI